MTRGDAALTIFDRVFFCLSCIIRGQQIEIMPRRLSLSRHFSLTKVRGDHTKVLWLTQRNFRLEKGVKNGPAFTVFLTKMSLKRKRTSQGKQTTVTAPEPPKSPSPPPWNLPFPRLPTVDDSISNAGSELKSVTDRYLYSFYQSDIQAVYCQQHYYNLGNFGSKAIISQKYGNQHVAAEKIHLKPLNT